MKRHNRRLRVVHCLTSLDFGGVESHIETLFNESVDLDVILYFVAIGRGGITEKNLKSLGANVYCLNLPVKIPSFSALVSLLFIFLRIRPDIVHCHGAEANFHGIVAAKLVGVPLRICEEIGLPRHSIYAKLVFRLIYKLAHRIIGISDAVVDWLIKSNEVPANKLVRIYNPVRIPLVIDNKNKSNSVFRVGFVGRLESEKNPLVLVDACANLIAQGINIELLIVGDGSLRAELESKITALNVENFIKVVGYQRNPEYFIQKCHVYIQPSISEGFGIAIVEAMGLGLPVIAPNIGGAPEFVVHGENGWLLRDISVECVTTSLIIAYHCGLPLLEIMGLRAREDVLSRFTSNIYIKNLYSLYEENLLLSK